MLRRQATLTTALIIISTLSGCQYDRSFMNMDSNSGSPFFGLQFAVDSGSRPSKSTSDSKPNIDTSTIHRLDDSEHDLPFQRQLHHGNTGRKLPVQVVSLDHGRSGRTNQKSRNRNGTISIMKPNESRDASSAELVDLRLSAF